MCGGYTATWISREIKGQGNDMWVGPTEGSTGPQCDRRVRIALRVEFDLGERVVRSADSDVADIR